MTCDEKVQVILLADAALTAVVPAARIKTPGDWQAMPRPYIIHQPQAGQVIHTHDGGLQPLRIWDFYEVAVYALTHGEARTIGDLVVNALDGYSDSDVQRIALASPPSAGPYDTDRKLARVSIDFEIAGTLT